MRSMPHIHKERLAAGRVRQLRVFIDKCSIEVFDADGKMSMTNLVFPPRPTTR
jgi:sucrose-6-phosphate hydrolase SacC (GH32 family)